MKRNIMFVLVLVILLVFFMANCEKNLTEPDKTQMKEQQSPSSLEKSKGGSHILIGKNGYLLETDQTVEERIKENRDLSENPGKREIPKELKEFLPPGGDKKPDPEVIKNTKRLSPEDCEKYNMPSQSEVEEILLKEGNKVTVEIGGTGSSVLGKSLGHHILYPLSIDLYFDVGILQGWEIRIPGGLYDLVKGWGGSAAEMSGNPKDLDYMDVDAVLWWLNDPYWVIMSEFGGYGYNISSVYNESRIWGYPMQYDHYWYDNGTHYFSENWYGGVASFEGYSSQSPVVI